MYNAFSRKHDNRQLTHTGMNYFCNAEHAEIIQGYLKANPKKYRIIGDLLNDQVDLATKANLLRGHLANVNKQLGFTPAYWHHSNMVSNCGVVRNMLSFPSSEALANASDLVSPWSNKPGFIFRGVDYIAAPFNVAAKPERDREPLFAHRSQFQDLCYAIDSGQMSEDSMMQLYDVVACAAVRGGYYNSSINIIEQTVFVNGVKTKVDICSGELSKAISFVLQRVDAVSDNFFSRGLDASINYKFVEALKQVVRMKRVHSEFFKRLDQAMGWCTVLMIRSHLASDFSTAMLELAGIYSTGNKWNNTVFYYLIPDDPENEGVGNLTQEQAVEKLIAYYQPLADTAGEESIVKATGWGGARIFSAGAFNSSEKEEYVELGKDNPEKPAEKKAVKEAPKTQRKKRSKAPVEPIATTTTT